MATFKVDMLSFYSEVDMICELVEKLESEMAELGICKVFNNLVETDYRSFFNKTINEKKYKNFFILSDLKTYENYTEVFELAQKSAENITIKLLASDIVPSIYNAEKIEVVEKFDAMIIIGNSSILEIGKYLASIYDNEFYIIPTNSFSTYNLTSFNFIFDGINFDFYKSNTAKAILFDKELLKFNEINIKNMIAIYLTNKVSLYENKFLKMYAGNDVDKNILEYLTRQYKIIDEIISTNLTPESIMNFVSMFIKISLIMEHVGGTKLFFLSPFFLACTYLCLTSYTENDFCNLNRKFSFICLKLYLKKINEFTSKAVNLSILASDMKKIFNLNFVSIFKFLKPVPEQNKLKSEEYKLKFTKEQCVQSLNKIIAELEEILNNVQENYKIDEKIVNMCVSYGSEFYAKPCMLGFFRNHGTI
ncbi:MAG: hypothetical protein RR334_00135 [Clostridia bacterium]